MKTALVTGAAGTIGHQLVKRLKSEGYWVRGVDLIYPPYSQSQADDFVIADLRNPLLVSQIMFSPNQRMVEDKENSFDEVFALASRMGGAGYIFTGENDAEIMHDSVLINTNTAHFASKMKVKKLFFSSSACVYPQNIQEDTNNPGLKESDAWPAFPDSVYGIEKLFSEKIYDAYSRNHGLNIRIGRFHNIYSVECHYNNGLEKAPAAICRKVIEAHADMHGRLSIWGDGEQTRSFLYIDDCIDAIRLLMESDFKEPINIGSEEMVSINQLVEIVKEIANKKYISVDHEQSNALGVRGRNSDNTLARKVLNGWEPKYSLKEGLTKTFNWIKSQYL